MRNPNAAPVEKEKEPEWADESGDSQVVHLTTQTFSTFIKVRANLSILLYDLIL